MQIKLIQMISKAWKEENKKNKMEQRIVHGTIKRKKEWLVYLREVSSYIFDQVNILRSDLVLDIPTPDFYLNRQGHDDKMKNW